MSFRRRCRHIWQALRRIGTGGTGHMGKVVADITMSLDGFITGPDDAPGRGLGEGGECLHNWVMGRPWRYDDEGRRFDPLDVDRKVLWEAMGSTGAGIIGRRMFDITGGWGGNPPGGAGARDLRPPPPVTR